MNRTFVDYYRCPEEFAGCFLDGEQSGPLGHFRFGADAICYGSISKGKVHPSPDGKLHDALQDAVVKRGTVGLSFDPDQVVNNLRFERYCGGLPKPSLLSGGVGNKLYYPLRPLLGVAARPHPPKPWLSPFGAVSVSPRATGS